MNLAARLSNLGRMRTEDQRRLFRTQTDTEREQTAAWFLEKFKTATRELMRLRLERRKIALRFEREVKMRECRVRAKTGDVEAELEGLKKGGGELIAGRNVKV